MFSSPPRKRRVRPGDRVVVCGRPERVTVESVTVQPDGSVKMILDWGEFGKSRVYEHDEGQIWTAYPWVN